MNEYLYGHTMARTSYISMRCWWWWYSPCTRSTRL